VKSAGQVVGEPSPGTENDKPGHMVCWIDKQLTNVS